MNTAVTNGGNWTYPIDSSNLPPAGKGTFNNGSLDSVSCAGQVCVTAGLYTINLNSSLNNYLLVATYTTNSGAWDYTLDESTLATTAPNNFNNADQSDFSSVSCSDDLCAAAGFYTDTLSVRFPVLAVSNAQGTNWTYVIDSTVNGSDNYATLPHDLTHGQFNSVSCVAKICIAGGNYFDAVDNEYPMVAVFTAGPNTVSYPLSSPGNGGIVPANYSNDNFGDGVGTINSVSCSSTICVAGGTYNNNKNNTYPIVAASVNGGAWSYEIDDTSVLPAQYFPLGGTFNSVNCFDQVCIAGGEYTESKSLIYPMLAVRNNNASPPTWSYVIDASNFPPSGTTGFTLGGFFGVSCSGAYCTAGGTMQDNNGLNGLVAVSSDATATSWTSYPIISATNRAPNSATSACGVFEGVNSNNNNTNNPSQSPGCK